MKALLTLAHARSLDLRAEPDDREIRIVLDGAADRVLERQLEGTVRPRPDTRDLGRRRASCAPGGGGDQNGDERARDRSE